MSIWRSRRSQDVPVVGRMLQAGWMARYLPDVPAIAVGSAERLRRLGWYITTTPEMAAKLDMRRGPKEPINVGDGLAHALVPDSEYPHLREPEFLNHVLEALVPGHGFKLTAVRVAKRSTLYMFPPPAVDVIAQLPLGQRHETFRTLAGQLMQQPEIASTHKQGGVHGSILEVWARRSRRVGPAQTRSCTTGSGTAADSQRPRHS